MKRYLPWCGVFFLGAVILDACGGRESLGPAATDAGIEESPPRAGSPRPADPWSHRMGGKCDAGVDAGAGPARTYPKLLAVGADGPGGVYASLHVGSSWYIAGSFVGLMPMRLENLASISTAPATAGALVGCSIGTGFDGPVTALVRSPSAIYVGGSFTRFRGVSVNYIAKLDPVTCAVDATFSPPASNGFSNAGSVFGVRAMALSGDDLFVGGAFTSYRGVAGAANHIAKLDATTGAIDTAFGPAGTTSNGFDSPVAAIAVDGASVYVGGAFTAYRGAAASANRIAKLDRTTGALDTTFTAPGNGFGGVVHALAISPPSVLVGGGFVSYRGWLANRIAKLDLVTGALDTTFSPPGTNGFDADVTTLAPIGADVYVGGAFLSYRGFPSSANKIARLKIDTGAIDAAFSPPGPGLNGFDGVVSAILPTEKDVFVGGRFTRYRSALGSAHYFAKLSAASGALDTTFRPPDSTIAGFAGGTAGSYTEVKAMLLSGTTLWLGGTFAAYGGASARDIAKLDDVTFAVDTTFSPPANNGFGESGSTGVYALASSGRWIYATGGASTYRGVRIHVDAIAKLDAVTGVLDTTFTPTGAGQLFNASIVALAATPTHVYAAGHFWKYKDVPYAANGIAKLDAVTGALDTTFSPPAANGVQNRGGGTGYVWSLALDGRDLFIGGHFDRYRNVPDSANGIAKLDAVTGAMDTTFSPPGIAGNGFRDERDHDGIADVSALALDGKNLYVGGSFTSYRGVPGSANCVARLDRATGAIDTTFSPSGPPATLNGFGGEGNFTSVAAIALGKADLYVGGTFTSYRGVPDSAHRIAKLDRTTGAIDTLFSPPGAPPANGFDRGYVNSLTLVTPMCPGGDRAPVLLVGGGGRSYRGAPVGNVTMLDPTTGALQ